MRHVVLAAALILGSPLASAHIDPHNAALHAAHNDWLARQYSVGGVKCCDERDVEVLIDPRWRINNRGRYEVFFNEAWHELRPDQIMQPRPDDPPPYPEALLFRSNIPNHSLVFCFKPPALF